MTELSKEIFKHWQVRHKEKQKLAFIQFLKEKLPGLTVEEGGLPCSRNLVLGDVDSARVIFSAHYDTCSVLPFPNFLPPKNIFIFLLYNLLITAVVFVLVFGVSRLAAALFHSFWASYFSGLAVCFLCIFVMLGGKANPHTANDNTSGVITLCEIYAALSEEQRQKAAFVWFDNEELGLFGSRQFLKRHKKKMGETLLLNFDCVSDGDYLMLLQNKAARLGWGELLEKAFTEPEGPPAGKSLLLEKSSRVIYPSDQMGFPCYAAMAVFRKKKGVGLYMSRIHTKRDTVFQEENIAYICGSALRLVQLL